MGVLAATHNVLVNDVVVGLADVRICHILELSETLELVRSDKIVVLLASEDFENGFRLGVEVQFIIVSIIVWQDKFEQALLLRPCINGCFLLRSLATSRGLGSFALFTVCGTSGWLIEEVCCGHQVKSISQQVCLHVLVQLGQSLFDVSIGQYFIVVDVK